MVHQASGHQLISPRSCIPSFDHLGTLQDGHRTSVDCSLALNAAQRSFRTSSIRSILHPNAALQPCLNVGHGRVQHHFVTIQLKVHLRMKHHSNPSNKLQPKCILGIQSSGVIPWVHYLKEGRWWCLTLPVVGGEPEFHCLQMQARYDLIHRKVEIQPLIS